MRSARYVGPLGGMALAFGAGIAILAGAGVASADTDDSSAPSSSSSSTSSSSSSSASPSSGSASEASAGATTATADDTSESTPSGGTKVDRRIHTKVDRRIQLTVPRRTEATTGRVSTKTALDEDEDDDADEGSSTTRRGTTRSSGDADEPTDTESTDSDAQASVLAYTSTLSNPGTQQISAVAVVADDPPPADSPDEVIVPAVARQEPFDYTLDIKVNDNVITGTNIAPKFSDWNNPLTYTVIGAPVAGGKVNLDETKGNFTFLPYTADFDAERRRSIPRPDHRDDMVRLGAGADTHPEVLREADSAQAPPGPHPDRCVGAAHRPLDGCDRLCQRRYVRR